jgi:predicted alpha/beta-fold hydrolase
MHALEKWRQILFLFYGIIKRPFHPRMPIIEDTSYNPPYVLSNPHVATIVPNLLRFSLGVRYERQRVETLDGDFLDLDWSRVGSERLMIISHGLEGSSRAKCVTGMVKFFNKRNWDVLAWNFRSCSGDPNRKPHYYHPGQTDDFQQLIDIAEEQDYEEIALVGFSLGGACTLRYLGEKGADLSPRVRKSVVFSAPTDLGACARNLSEGRNTYYARSFLSSYRKKMAAKEKLHPGSNDLNRWEEVKTVVDFDRVFNAHWYDCPSPEDFYRLCNPHHLIPNIEIPTLIVNAENDPFLPEKCYPIDGAGKSNNVYLEIPKMGGHIGFMTLSWKGIFWSETRAEAFLDQD